MRLLHVRGDVPGVENAFGLALKSPPRTWGCTPCSSWFAREQHVSSTYVGMYPRAGQPPSSAVCLPHVRGGVPHLLTLPHNRSRGLPHTLGDVNAPEVIVGRESLPRPGVYLNVQ